MIVNGAIVCLLPGLANAHGQFAVAGATTENGSSST